MPRCGESLDADRIVEQAQAGAANLSAFLTMIRACEGTLGENGYRALFGYRQSRDGPLFDDFHDHPNIRASFQQTDGTLGFTTAAGAYQFIYATWKRLQAQLELPDFGPASQDDAATELIRQRGALDDVRAGRLTVAIGKCWPIWASLPGSTYAQPVRAMAFAQTAYTDAGGVLA